MIATNTPFTRSPAMTATATMGAHTHERRTPSSATIATSRQSSIGYSWLARTRNTNAAGTSCSRTSALRPALGSAARARRARSSRQASPAAMPAA
jgi:hypothetical protein